MDFSQLVPNPSESTDDTVMIRASTWTPEQQIARLLSLCEAQMESALSESDVAVQELVKSFAGLIEAGQALGSMSEKAPEAGATDMAAQLDALKKQTAAAIVAFQFYDKLTQRLGHVRYSLSALAMFVCDGAKTGERDQWRRMFATLRRLYRTEEERQLFRMMVEGASAEEAREHIQQSTLTLRAAPTGEIEIF
ncbi:MAG TPA: hypothetical protein VN705_26440 [Steroidobacteraceae bacterium]|jgi:hypothetical protein|nr:hypothetical protein [Steroidobacteraceae bacterium]